TYSYFWYLDHYVNRVRTFGRLSPEKQKDLASKTIRKLKRRILNRFSDNGRLTDQETGNDLRAIYWPGADFVPTIHRGRVTVFRIQKQPYTRIRDAQLGWGKRATGGVEVHTIPGEHHTILREPHVLVLAQKLGDCIRRAQEESQSQSAIQSDASGCT